MSAHLIREVDGRTLRKSTASGAGNDCVYLSDSGPNDVVHDSKSGITMRLPAAQLVAFAKSR